MTRNQERSTAGAPLVSRDGRPLSIAIFDKDGTLIDFDAMWSGWAETIAEGVAAGAGPQAVAALARRWGFEPGGSLDPHGALAIEPMGTLYDLAVAALRDAGLSQAEAARRIAALWHAPDPVALARPLADLPRLFGGLRAAGLRIAVVTTDNRAPTSATLAALGVGDLVETMVCGDDDLPHKPAPDAVAAVCRRFGGAPSQAAVIGDTEADVRMGRAAGAGLVIGVLSGAGSEQSLAPHADLLLPSVAALLPGGC